MIKKLSRRFTSIAMLMTGTVLLVLLSILYVFFIVYTYRTTESSMKIYAITPSEIPSYGTDITDDAPNLAYLRNVCTVSVNPFGIITVLDNSTGSMSDAAITDAVVNTLQRSDGFGVIGGRMLFYYRYTDNATHCIRIAFAGAAGYYDDLQTLLVLLLIVFAVVMLLIWLIARFTVRLSLGPAQKTWDQQQNFIADASHELKTPLTVILTNTNILLSHPEDKIADQITWVNSTLEESAHMKDLVEKLLLLAKTDDLSQKDMFTTVDLSELAIKLSLQYEPIAFEKGVMLKTDIRNGIRMQGEPTALNQIIHILLDNAIKYAGIAGTVSLALRRTQKNVILTCINTGDPIPPEDLPHIFERFYRSDKVRTAGKGYGLGLAICKNLVDVHRGEIYCSSNPVSGTTFTVIFKALK